MKLGPSNMHRKRGEPRPLMAMGGAFHHHSERTDLAVWACWPEGTARGAVGHMLLIVDKGSRAETVRWFWNRGRMPRRAGTITVDGYQWDGRTGDIEEVQWDGRWYSPHQGVALIADGAPFVVAEKSKAFEWCYRGWPPPASA